MDKRRGSVYLPPMTTVPAVRFLDRTTPPHVSTLILIAGLSALNMSIFLPSLKAMAEHFGTDYAVMQFAVSGYLAATAVLQVMRRTARRPLRPATDPAGRDRDLRRRDARLPLAPTAGIFLGFRMLQAVVATGMVLSRAIVRDIFPPTESASMIGWVTMGMALVPMVGPSIGGVLDELSGWQASFVFLRGRGHRGGRARLVGPRRDGRGQGHRLRPAGPQLSRALSPLPASGATRCAPPSDRARSSRFSAAPPSCRTRCSACRRSGPASRSARPAIGYAIGNGISGRYSVAVGINRMALAGTLVSSGGMALSLLLSLGGLAHPVVFFGLCTFLGLGNGLLMPNATAGLLSVRPELAGTASGLGGAIMIGGGAALAALAGALLTPASGALPLQWIMFLTSLAAALSILLVIRRERRLGL